MIHDALIGVIGSLLYLSGLLVWPACVLLWRKRKRRTRALHWVFFSQLLGDLVILAFFAFSQGILEHQYYWLMLMIMLNVFCTPLALLAAIYDSGKIVQSAA
jgi:hypothetical protein